MPPERNGELTKKQQVANAFRKLIADGYWNVGESVGDLWKLQEESHHLFGVRVSWGTIRAAEQELVEEGLLSPIQQGVPTRVIAVPHRPDPASLVAGLRALHEKLGALHSELGQLIAEHGGGSQPSTGTNI